MELLYERDQLNRDVIKAKDKSIKHMNIVALWDDQAKRAIAQIQTWRNETDAVNQKIGL